MIQFLLVFISLVILGLYMWSYLERSECSWHFVSTIFVHVGGVIWDLQTKITVHPVKTQISLSAWRKLVSLDTHWSHSEDWSVWSDAQGDRWAHSHFVCFVMLRLICMYSIASNCIFKINVWYLSHRRTARAQARLRIRAVSLAIAFAVRTHKVWK